MKKFALTVAVLAICLLALASSAAIKDDERSEDDGGDDEGGRRECPRETKTVTKTIGGKEISQEVVQISAPSGDCIWVLSGGTPESYVNADDCSRCVVKSGSPMCSGSGVSAVGFCKTALGPDCRVHAVGERPELPCPEPAALPPPTLPAKSG